MDARLRKRLDDFFDVGFGKTTGIDTALQITKIYAGSASADAEKIPALFVALAELFEPYLDGKPEKIDTSSEVRHEAEAGHGHR